MSQTQTQVQTQSQTQKIKRVFQKLKEYLPIEVYDFKNLVDQELKPCEFWFDESVEPTEKIVVTDDIMVERFEKEYNHLLCEEKEYTIIFKNSIYLDYLEDNKIILLGYEVKVKENEQ
jgi:hypothetical protein